MKVVMLVSLIGLGVLLSACGQTGPLYLPAPEQERGKDRD